MTRFTNPQALRRVGIPTPQTVIYKSESHKLHQAFPVASGVDIIAGSPVYLKTDGTISNKSAEGQFIGIAVTNSETPAYPAGAQGVEVTVMMEGFAVVYGVAAGSLTAGYVADNSANDEDGYRKYKAPSGVTTTNFIALNSAEDGELIQVLIR